MTETIGEPDLDLDLSHSWRSDNVGRLLLAGYGFFEGGLMRRLEQSGFPMVRHVHFNVLRNLDPQGTRIVDLAARAQITKGSMGKIVKECEQLGLVELRVDPQDGRAKVVSFAPPGIEVMKAIRVAMIEVQEDMARITGEKDMAALLRALRALQGRAADAEEAHAPKVRVRR